MEISVALKETEQPIKYSNVLNAYQKGSFYCVYVEGGYVYKHPIETIWRIKEEYGEHQTKQAKKSK